MVVLKKVRASTLMETLVATVLIIIVFLLSSMIFNNLFFRSITNNTEEVDAYINELIYLYENDKLILPYVEDFNNWELKMHKEVAVNGNSIVIDAFNTKTGKIIDKHIKTNN